MASVYRSKGHLSRSMDKNESKGYNIRATPSRANASRKISMFSFIFAIIIIPLYVFISPNSFHPYNNFIQPYSGLQIERLFSSSSGDVVMTPIIASVEQSNNPKLTDMVQWDKYSLIIKGQRIFLHSGEFHPWRLPVPSLWLDVLQKIKAAGLNAISIYTHWGLVNPSPGVYDFDGFRSLQTLFDAAKETGLWVVLRPGPYINAETTAGGIAHWVTTQVQGGLRTNATDFRNAWEGYIKAIIDITVPNQITNGGPVIAIQIDNEYDQYEYGHAEYFQQLEDFYRNHSIVVPLTYNDAGMTRSFVNGTGAVDLYGIDAYPQRFDCSHPLDWNAVDTNYRSYHEEVNPSQPLYSPEFQAGAYDAWGPNAPGYEFCRVLTNSSFQDVFYKSLWADNAKMINYYMLYGGTSWGHLPFPGVYTSYDYGSPIAENRALTEKYRDLKRQGLFLRSSQDFYKTDWIGNNTSSVVHASSSDVLVTLLENPDSHSKYFIARQAESTSTKEIEFRIDADTSRGSVSLPRLSSGIKLSGRESKVIVTDYRFGKFSLVVYSTASVLFAGTIGGRDILYLYGNPTETHELSMMVTGNQQQQLTNDKVQYSRSGTREMTVTFLDGILGLLPIVDSDTQLVLYSDTETAGTFFSPMLTNDGLSDDLKPFKNFWQFGTNNSILVGGPYLVRDASLLGSKLDLFGDLLNDATLTVIAPKEVQSITWNGQRVDVDLSTKSMLSSGVFVASLSVHKEVNEIELPKLDNWKYADSLPEIQAGFIDESWIMANHTKTNNPFPPHYGDGNILYSCDYGFCEGIVIWRGHFNATGQEKSVNLSINGGEAFAASVWLNDAFIGTTYGNSSNNQNIVAETDEIFHFPEGALIKSKNNVITIVQDNMGLDEDEGNESIKSPRGIRGYKLNKGHLSSWKVQGKIGGFVNYPDKTRGIFNEGGTFGERQGWHLPGFDTSSWNKRLLSKGLPKSAAGVGFFVTTFDLNIPKYLDVSISINFENEDRPYRAFLFVNGWLMGKRIANLGPQTKFPVHQGILDYTGTNTVAVALWVMEPGVEISPNLYLSADTVVEGDFNIIDVDNPPWQNRSEFLH